jgi:hypothetical protein
LVQTPHEKLMLARSRELDRARFESAMDMLESRCSDYDEPAVRRLLGDLVPEYGPSTADESQSNVVSLDKAKR